MKGKSPQAVKSDYPDEFDLFPGFLFMSSRIGVDRTVGGTHDSNDGSYFPVMCVETTWPRDFIWRSSNL
ncbi:MAG: hypothetical protein KF861_04545 [Planctomycetaceae bacterium]|nr:hypothetical protein [Planctomycetaceae bacterium]